MNERPGTALRILYQLFIALNRNKVIEGAVSIAVLFTVTTETGVEWTVSRVHSKSWKNKVGESGDLNISGGEVISAFSTIHYVKYFSYTCSN